MDGMNPVIQIMGFDFFHGHVHEQLFAQLLHAVGVWRLALSDFGGKLLDELFVFSS
jgi:hypothetical protein